MMNNSDGKVRTLEEALKEPRKHRDIGYGDKADEQLQKYSR